MKVDRRVIRLYKLVSQNYVGSCCLSPTYNAVQLEDNDTQTVFSSMKKHTKNCFVDVFGICGRWHYIQAPFGHLNSLCKQATRSKWWQNARH